LHCEPHLSLHHFGITMGRGQGGGQCSAFIALTFSWKGKKIENLSFGFDHGFPARRFQLLLIVKSSSLHHLLRWFLSLAVFLSRENSYCIDIGLREVNCYHIYSNEIVEQMLGNGRTGSSWYWPWKVGYRLSSLPELHRLAGIMNFRDRTVILVRGR
jgi:hypothetical protein